MIVALVRGKLRLARTWLGLATGAAGDVGGTDGSCVEVAADTGSRADRLRLFEDLVGSDVSGLRSDSRGWPRPGLREGSEVIGEATDVPSMVAGVAGGSCLTVRVSSAILAMDDSSSAGDAIDSLVRREPVIAEDPALVARAPRAPVLDPRGLPARDFFGVEPIGVEMAAP